MKTALLALGLALGLCGAASNASAQAAGQFACSGRVQAPGSPTFIVTLVVDGEGTVSRAVASWTSPSRDPLTPLATFSFDLPGERLSPSARNAEVFAMIALWPPPAAKTADIVLLWNGAEVARRPWPLYAKSMAELADSPQRPFSFYGPVLFAPSQEGADAGLRDLLAKIGDQPGKLGVRVVGPDGGVVGGMDYDISPAPDHDPSLASALQAAQAAARTPTGCQKLDR